MATQDDIRIDWIQHEYTGMRDALNKLIKRMDGYEAALLGLTEAVSQNSQRLDAVEQRLDAVEQRLTSIERLCLKIALSCSQSPTTWTSRWRSRPRTLSPTDPPAPIQRGFLPPRAPSLSEVTEGFLPQRHRESVKHSVVESHVPQAR